MNRRDLTRFEDLNKLIEDKKRKEDFNFFIDDATEDLKYK